jgi:hypothetical protein
VHVSPAPMHGRSCSSHSPTLRPWIDPLPTLGRRRLVLRGGVLEPESQRDSGKMSRQKPTHVFQRIFKRGAQRSLSLSGGASIRFSSSSSWASPSGLVRFRLRNDEGDPAGSPSSRLLCG